MKKINLESGTIQRMDISQVVIPSAITNLYDYESRQFEIDTIKNSIEEFGQFEPITVVKFQNEYNIIHGVIRFKAINCLKLNEVLVNVLNVDTQSPDFCLEDLIVHAQIQKVKRPVEILNEFVSYLRLDQKDSNSLRDRNKRYEFLSKMLGKGWGRNNVITLANSYSFEKENGDFLKMSERLIEGNIVPSNVAICLNHFKDGYNVEEEKESEILKGYLNRLITQEEIDLKIHQYRTKKQVGFTEVEIEDISLDDCLIIQGDNKQTRLPKDTKVNFSLTSIPYYDQIVYGDSEDESGRKNKGLNQYFEDVCKPFELNYDNIAEDGVVVINFNESYKNGFCLDIESGIKAQMKKIGYKYLQPVIWNKNMSGKPKNDKIKRLANQFEYILIFTKSNNYYFNPIRMNTGKKNRLTEGAKEQGGRKSTHISNNYTTIQDFCSEQVAMDVINLSITSNRIRGKSKSEFFGGFPTLLPVPFILTFCPPGKQSVVWDPFGGEGTTACMALLLGRSAVIQELYEKNCERIEENIIKYKMEFVDENEIEFLNQQYELVA